MAFSKLAKSFQLFELLLLKICFPSGIQPVWPAGDIIFQLLAFFIKETLSNNTIICQSWIKSLPSTKKTQKFFQRWFKFSQSRTISHKSGRTGISTFIPGMDAFMIDRYGYSRYRRSYQCVQRHHYCCPTSVTRWLDYSDNIWPFSTTNFCPIG